MTPKTERRLTVVLGVPLCTFYLVVGFAPNFAACHATQPAWAAPIEDGAASGLMGAVGAVLVTELQHRWHEEPDGGVICSQILPDGGVQ